MACQIPSCTIKPKVCSFSEKSSVRKEGLIIHASLAKGLKGTKVTQTRPSVNGGLHQKLYLFELLKFTTWPPPSLLHCHVIAAIDKIKIIFVIK